MIFGLPGGAILPVYDPIIDSPIRHILVRHEQGAGHMAEGFAHATGRPGVAMVTSGPGATNIVTPLCDAYMDSIPMVVITGQVADLVARHRRLPGVRHHRHHHGGDQAQLPGHRGAGHPPDDPRGVPHRHHRTAGAGAGRRAQGHRRSEEPALGHGLVLARDGRPAGLPPRDPRRPGAGPPGGRADPGRRATGHLRRRRHPQGPGGRGAARAGRAVRHPRGHHADGAGRLPRRPSAGARHARHARQLHRGHVDAAVRPADRAGQPVRRPGHRARSTASPPRPRSSTSTSTRPSWARCADPTWASSATAAW